MDRIRTIEKFDEIMQKARSFWPNFNANPTLHIMDNMGRYAGDATMYRVRLNSAMLGQSEALWANTIAHEIAHVVCMYFGWDHGHGKNWRRVASMLGANPRATFSTAETGVNIKYKRKLTRFLYNATCGTQVWVSSIIHSKIQKGQTRILRSTGGKIYSSCYTGQTKKS